MASTLWCIKEHDFSNEGMFIQPWKREQVAKVKMETKKKNQKKAAMMTVKTTTQDDQESVLAKVGAKPKQPSTKKSITIDEDDEPLLVESKCCKICIFPNPFQKELIKSWMGTVRWTYNTCNAAVRDGLCGYSIEEL